MGSFITQSRSQLDYIRNIEICTMNGNGFTLKKEKKNIKRRRYPAETITDDLALLANNLESGESLLLEAGGKNH